MGRSGSMWRTLCSVGVVAVLGAAATTGGAPSAGADPVAEVMVASPMDNGTYFFEGGVPALAGAVEDLNFSVYATEIDRAADGALWVRDYLSIVRIAPDEQTYTRVVGLSDYADLDSPSIGTPADNVGLDPDVELTQIAWEGGRRMAVDPSGRLVFVDRDQVFRIGSDGLIELLAGTGVRGNSGDGGPATDADIAPMLLQADSSGAVWFVDEGRTQLRRIGADGTIVTAATSSEGINDFAIEPDGDIVLLVQLYDESGSHLVVRRTEVGGTPVDVALDDDGVCTLESGESSSQADFAPASDGAVVEFVGLDELGADGWSRCVVDLTTGTTGRTSLGLDPLDSRYSNIELGDESFWFMRYDSDVLERSGLVRVGGDQPAPATVSLGDQSGLERDLVTGSVFVPVTLSRPVPEPVVVSFHTEGGSATAGVDFATWGTPARPRSVTIPAGALQTTVNVPVLTDDDAEADETFSVVIDSVVGGGAVVGDGTGVGTIVDPDALASPNPVITVSSSTIHEGDDGRRLAQFQIHLSRPPLSNVSLTYVSVDGTATAPGDYVAKLPGSVVFAPGQISKTVDVLVESDVVAGPDRGFSLSVDVTGGSPVEELDMSGTADIIDDD